MAMGTVGLNFGSPTGGQGINVSQTVSQITSIMQNIETPWKTQLAQLQSQDTVYTTLGTDLSNLTTSLQTLTNFQGVLESKQGSSSNTNVLQLLSASNTALAGSHTVTVNSLAQTASYYSEDFSNPNDLVSGSLTLTVNGGTPVTINTASGGETIAQIASDVNNANAGVTANIITDSGGSRLSLVSNTSGTTGNFTVGTTLKDTTNTSNTISFTQAQAGSNASFVVDGISETSTSNTVTNAIPGVSFQLLSAAASSPVQVEIANNNTAVETAVQSFVTAYNTALTDINTQEGNTSTGTPEPLFGNPTVALLQSQLQAAMTYIVPSGLTATGSQSTGYTFTAPSATDTYTAAAGAFGTGASGTGSSAAITTPSTLTQIAADLNASGTGYSATLNSTDTAMTVTASSSTPATLAASAPTLQASGSGSISSITQLGVSVNNNGTLTLNVSALDATLNSNYQDVVNFLQPSSTYTSFGGNFTTILNNLGTQAPNGSVYLAQQQNQTIEASLNTNITNENTLIAQKTQTLTAELNQANFTLTQIPQQLGYMNELYSSFSGYNINPNFG